MTRKSRGVRSKTRQKLKSRVRPTITKFLQEFKSGQIVMIEQEPSSYSGMPFPRYKGKSGKVISKRGKAYIIEIADGNKVKQIIAKPEHLKAI